MHDPEAHSVNPSDNPELSDIVASRLSRRTVLAGGTAAAVGFLGASAAGLVGAAGAGRRRVATLAGGAGSQGRRRQLLGFAAVPAGTDDAVVVPTATSREVLIPWGTPLRSAARRGEGRLEHRRRAGAAGRCPPRRHALLPARRGAAPATGAGCSCSTTSTPTSTIYSTPTATTRR